MNTTVEQSAPVEFRMTGGTLTGTAIGYGERAQDRAEMFLPGSFISGLDTAALNLQHDREHVIAEQPDELAFTNSVRSLALRAQLRPDSAEARLVSRGALRGLSVEFVAIEERQDRGLRVISKAHLAGVGLVDSGSYRTEVEIRQRMASAWFRATFPPRLKEYRWKPGDAYGCDDHRPGTISRDRSHPRPTGTDTARGLGHRPRIRPRSPHSVA